MAETNNYGESDKNRKRRHKRANERRSVVAVGEFIRTFVFSLGAPPQLPIVQPGGSLVFSIPTVLPLHVIYVDSKELGTGVLVPRGTYRVRWAVNPSRGGEVTLMVNREAPTTVSAPNFPYTKLISSGIIPIFAEHLVVAPLRRGNLLSLVNTGSQLFTLGDLPNTRIGDTAVLTQVLVERVG